MKFRSYFFSIVGAGLLLSCSDNDDISEIPVFTPDATLSFATSLDGVVPTKAEADVSPDANIYRLQMIVFTGEGEKATFQKDTFITYSTPEKYPVISDLPVQSGRISLLVLTNRDRVTGKFGDPISKVLETTISLDQEGNNNGYTMSSAINSYSIVPGKHNTIGSGSFGADHTPGVSAGPTNIDLIRNVSKVNLVRLTLKADKLEDGSTPVRFKVDSIFVANVKSTSYMASLNGAVEKADAPWWFGAFAESSYNDIYSTVSGDQKNFLLLNVAKGENELANGVTVTAGNSYPASADGQPIGKSFLVYENMNRNSVNEVPLGEQTMLVVCGDYTRRLADGSEITDTDRFYTVPVNNYDYGVDKDKDIVGIKHEFIKRNVKYNIALTIKSSGSSTPYGKDAYAHIAAKLEVLPWNVISISSSVD